MFEIDQLVRLAKRENNQKRSYLYVNPMQGKHIPIEPNKMKDMCKELARLVSLKHRRDKLLVIGFAETATAIAAYVALNLDNALYYQTTTREREDGDTEFIYFTESHSHATEQFLNAKWFDDYLFMVDRIVFVEDEVTTGNTICKLIKAIDEKYTQKHINYTIASVLNSMSETKIEELENKGIDCIFVEKLPFEYMVSTVNDLPEISDSMYDYTNADADMIDIQTIMGKVNPRYTCKIDEYAASVNCLCGCIYEREFREAEYQKLLVIGTEEFMYPAIEFASYVQDRKRGIYIKTHSTTRSPIMAYSKENYPLRHRVKVRSPYEDERITYIYNLDKYDKVVIISDAKSDSIQNLKYLCSALKDAGNENISVYRWSV